MVTINLTAKAIAGMIAGSCSSTVVRTIIKNNIQPENTFQAVQIWIGSMGIGGLVGEAVQARTERQITKWEPLYERIRTEVAEQSSHS